MGTQPSGGYFQHMIAFIVLLGLTYSILESYIDNIGIHAQRNSAAPKPTEYLNLMQEIAIGEEELAVLAHAPNLSAETHAKPAKVNNSTKGYPSAERTMFRLKRLNDTWLTMSNQITPLTS